MTAAESIEQLGRVLAELAASRLESLELGGETITARPVEPEVSFGRSFPLVAVSLPCTGAAVGETLVVLSPDAATTLVRLLATGTLAEDTEVDDDALAAIALAIDALYADAGARLRDALELDLSFGIASAQLVHGARDMPTVEPGSWIASYTLQGDGPPLEIVQTIPAGLVTTLSPVESTPVPAAGEPVAGDDSTRIAIERSSAVAADAAADVLSALFSEELSAATPTVEQPADPFADLTFPLIVAEVSYVAGLAGSNRFILLPADAAQLAAAMMGTPETTGDGLSAIELSAVSEAMNQVMSATVTELSRALGVGIEASPPTCTIIEDAQQARDIVDATGYRARFRLVSTIFSAEIVQLVSPELAGSLTEAFAQFAVAQESSGDAFDAFADIPLASFADVLPEPPDPRAGARELLSGIRVRVSAELGRSRLPIARVANLPAGAIVVLDRAPTDPVDVLVNGTPFAQAKIVLVDGEYAVQILSLSPLDLNA